MPTSMRNFLDTREAGAQSVRSAEAHEQNMLMSGLQATDLLRKHRYQDQVQNMDLTNPTQQDEAMIASRNPEVLAAKLNERISMATEGLSQLTRMVEGQVAPVLNNPAEFRRQLDLVRRTYQQVNGGNLIMERVLQKLPDTPEGINAFLAMGKKEIAGKPTVVHETDDEGTMNFVVLGPQGDPINKFSIPKFGKTKAKSEGGAESANLKYRMEKDAEDKADKKRAELEEMRAAHDMVSGMSADELKAAITMNSGFAKYKVMADRYKAMLKGGKAPADAMDEQRDKKKPEASRDDHEAFLSALGKAKTTEQKQKVRDAARRYGIIY